MAKTKIRLVFVDIDGVLNSSRTVAAYGGYPFPQTHKDVDGKEIFNDPPLRLPEAIDRVSVDLLNKVLHDENAYFVWSTSWRIGMGVQGCREMARHLGLGEGRMLGRTPDLSGPDSRRGHEIRYFMWCLEQSAVSYTPEVLIKHGLLYETLARQLSPELDFEISTFCIIDDSTDMLGEQKPFFVNTNPDNGISYKNYVEMGNILQGIDRKTGMFFLENGEHLVDHNNG